MSGSGKTALSGGFSADFRYNPFTAADEKIPLSMVHVNIKPQHLVFSLHSQASEC
jgi:hypothetical protein